MSSSYAASAKVRNAKLGPAFLDRITDSPLGIGITTIYRPNDGERWRACDEKGHDSDDGFNRQRHSSNMPGGQGTIAGRPRGVFTVGKERTVYVCVKIPSLSRWTARPMGVFMVKMERTLYVYVNMP
jgi:hypothetical protein